MVIWGCLCRFVVKEFDDLPVGALEKSEPDGGGLRSARDLDVLWFDRDFCPADRARSITASTSVVRNARWMTDPSGFSLA